jgi:hypothetical protein
MISVKTTDSLGNTSLNARPVVHATLERRTLRVRGALVPLLSLFGGFGDTSSVAVSKGVASFVGETVRVGVTGSAGDAPIGVTRRKTSISAGVKDIV